MPDDPVLIVGEGVLLDTDADATTPLPGAVALLVDARRRGLRTVVVTTSGASALERAGLRALVDATVPTEAERSVVAALATVDAAAADGLVVASDPQLLAAAEDAGVAAVGTGPWDPERRPERWHPTTGDIDLDRLVPPVFERLGHGPLLQDGWVVIDDHHDPFGVADAATRQLTGNGYLGYRGTLAEWRAPATVGCTVSDTYDNADGKWSELCNVPNALYARWTAAGVPVEVAAHETLSDRDRLERRLDVRYGRQHRMLDPTAGPVRQLTDERFASLDVRHLVVQRQQLTAAPGTRLTCTTGIDGEVWSLNGDHFRDVQVDAADAEVLAVDLTTTERGLAITVAHGYALSGARLVDHQLRTADRSAHRVLEVEVDQGGVVELLQIMAVHTGNDVADPAAASREAVRDAVARGYEPLLARHAVAWERLWNRIDVRIGGDLVAQTVLRYNLYHNVIATPMHTDHLPIGARGLSCQAYQGAAFWDQEVFNLPMWVHTFPEVARNQLRYRHRTLDGARRKAARLGYDGAYYAWISGDTGDELCPDFFFVDVLTGRPIRNHFNVWQMHVSPDIAATVDGYVRATGDRAFGRTHGAEILIEVARFLVSFVLLRPLEGVYHLVRLLGPDEFHENVDDNVFSLEQSRVALTAAVRLVEDLERHDPGHLADLSARLDLDDGEVDRWRDVRDRLREVHPAPQTGLLEQFDGYLDLEDTTPEVVRSRLQHPDEYWGWPNGVAVHTQVTKQADVIQLFVNQPERYDERVVAANYRYYLPRTAHASSLSRPMYALVAARLGRLEEARELFLTSATVDLLATSHAAPGGTFIGGIHTAACGASWQVAVLGFGGVHVCDEHVEVAPRLPAGWESLAFTLVVRGQRLDVMATATTVHVRAAATNAAEVTVVVHGGAATQVPPGAEVAVPPSGGA